MGVIKKLLYVFFMLLSAFLIQKFIIKDKEIRVYYKIVDMVVQAVAFYVGECTDAFDSEKYHKLASAGELKSTEGKFVDSILVENATVKSLIDDYEIPIKILVPESNLEKLPIILYFHPGGFVYNSDTGTYTEFVKRGYLFIYVNYRLAPAFQFPHAHEDCYSVLQYLGNEKLIHPLLKRADLNNLYVLGESAGGHLVISVSLMARDRDSKVKIKRQALLEPCLFPVKDLNLLESRKTYFNGYILGHRKMSWFQRLYAPIEEESKEVKNPYLYPLEEKNYNGVPGTFIVLAKYDYLNSEGAILGERLKNESSQDTQVKEYPGVHGFLSIGKTPEFFEVIDDVCNFFN